MITKKYRLKNKDVLSFTGKQLKKWKNKIIEEYKTSEYPSRLHCVARRKGFLEAIDFVRQYVKNEVVLDPEPCCGGLRISNFLKKLDEIQEQGDRRFVLDKKHLEIINQMLKEGYSKNQIAKQLEVSISTIVYWTNPRFRRRQMEKNARRRFGKKIGEKLE